MIGADEHHVVQLILTATREPLDVVRVTQPVPVPAPRVVQAHLTAAGIELLQPLGMLARPMDIDRLVEVRHPLSVRGLILPENERTGHLPVDQSCLELVLWIQRYAVK